jgi:hypothetical protein
MSNISSIAAATVIIATLAYATAPAHAACDERFGPCKSVQAKPATAPLNLNQFLKRPVQANPSVKTAKPAGNAVKPTRIATKPASRPAVADSVANPAAIPTPVLASELAPASRSSETDGVAITSAEEINEIDAAADTVRIVAANEVNEIDLAFEATSLPAQSETTGQAAMVEEHQVPADNSWIGKVFLALGGVLAAASAARLLIA